MTPPQAQFRNRSFNERFKEMGDEAETAFEEWATDRGRGFVRYGLNRPPIHMASLPPFIRYTPDFLTAKALVEVQGFGRDQMFKLKDEKLEALQVWRRLHPVELFAWDSTNKRTFLVPLDDIVMAVVNGLTGEGMFPEGKPYQEFTADLLERLEAGR